MAAKQAGLELICSEDVYGSSTAEGHPGAPSLTHFSCQMHPDRNEWTVRAWGVRHTEYLSFLEAHAEEIAKYAAPKQHPAA